MNRAKPTDHWNTPSWLCEKLALYPAGVSLDPCSNERSVVPARVKLDGRPGAVDQDGLQADWARAGLDGLVFINPPYSDMTPWAEKFARTVAGNPDGQLAMLTKLDPTTRWWKTAIAESAGFVSFRGRLKFTDGELKRQGANFPSALIVSNTTVAETLVGLLEDVDWWCKCS